MIALIQQELNIQQKNINMDGSILLGQARRKILKGLGLDDSYCEDRTVQGFLKKMNGFEIALNMEDIGQWNISDTDALAFYEITNKEFAPYIQCSLQGWSSSVLGTQECALHLKPRFYSNDYDGMHFLLEKLKQGIIPKSSELTHYKFKNAPLSYVLMDMAGILMAEKNEPLLQELMAIISFYSK